MFQAVYWPFGGFFEVGVIPVLNVITMCLFTTILYETERTLLAPIMVHAVWNIVGAIFFGCVNLAEDYPHMFTLILLSGGEYKIEASIIVTIINIVLITLFFIKLKLLNRNKKIERGEVCILQNIGEILSVVPMTA